MCVWRDVCVCVEGGEERDGGMSVCVEGGGEEHVYGACVGRREGVYVCVVCGGMI